MSKDIKYIFLGGTYRGHQLFSSLVKKNILPEYVFITEEDEHEEIKYAERLQTICEEKKIPHRVCKKLSKKDYKLISKDQWDFGIVCVWRTLIDAEVTKYFKAGLIAAHDSLLPEYRGFAPLNWAIINGEKKTGVTLFQIREGEMDSGPVLNQIEVMIGENDYAIDVHKKVAQATIAAYENFILDFKSDSWTVKEQDEKKATYTCKRTPKDGKIIWDKSSKTVFNLIRALAPPYPCAFCVYDGKVFHIRKARLGKNDQKKFVGRIPGRVINMQPEGIEVLCGEGTILIEEWEEKTSGEIDTPSNKIKSITGILK